MKKIIRLSGLDCANCAAELEREILSIEGVQNASVAFVNQTLVLEYDSDSILEKVVYTIEHFEDVKVLAENENDGGRYATNTEQSRVSHVKDWCLIACSALLLGLGVVLDTWVHGLVADIFMCICFALAYVCVGYPVLFSTVKNIGKGKIFDENFLMTVASIGAFFLGEYAEGVLVMLLYQIGETLQAIAVQTSRKNIANLMELKSEWATVLSPMQTACACGCCHDHHTHEHEHEHEHEHDHHEHEHEHEQTEESYKRVRPEDVCVNDILLIKAGEKIPVDGELLDEKATLDTKSLTGEPEPRTYQTGDTLLSGAINVGASFRIRATKTYQDSAVANILQLVENATNSKADPEKFITKFARYYTPIVCGMALLLAVLAPILHGWSVGSDVLFYDFSRWLESALTFLVISCPCALIISVPLTYFSGIGACAKQGALVKGATYLDILAQVKTAAFDKTGTLTEGDFSVCGVLTQEGTTEEELLAIAAAAEKRSSHPIAKAFEGFTSTYTFDTVEEVAGRGLYASDGKTEALVGNAALLRERGVQIQESESLYTLVYVAKNGVFIGAIEIGDKLRSEAKEAVRSIKDLGISNLVMLTGDRENSARKIANEVGMSALKAELLPQEKLEEVKKMQSDGAVIYVGDGINDAPVMTVADCAVSMGTLGSAAAVEASDLVLISDSLSALPKVIKTARKTRRIVLQNIIFSVCMKLGFMVLGAFGVLPLGLAVFADVGVMLLAVCNSFRVRK